MTRVLAGTNHALGRDLAAHDLSPQGARTLVTLLEQGPMRVSLLAGLVGLEATGLSHLMRGLDQRGLLVRERDGNDHRSVSVALTTPGRALARRCADIQARHQAVLLKQFSAEDAARLRALLHRMVETIAAK